jgi:hypothetical protein
LVMAITCQVGVAAAAAAVAVRAAALCYSGAV